MRWLVLLVALGFGTWTAQASACRCLQRPPSQLLEESAAAFEGRVVLSADGQITFVVVQAWKGVTQERVSAGIPVGTSCDPALSVGQQVFVFTHADGSIDACSVFASDNAEMRGALGAGSVPVDVTDETHDETQVSHRHQLHASRRGCGSCTVGRPLSRASAFVFFVLAVVVLTARVRSSRRRVNQPTMQS